MNKREKKETNPRKKKKVLWKLFEKLFLTSWANEHEFLYRKRKSRENTISWEMKWITMVLGYYIMLLCTQIKRWLWDNLFRANFWSLFFLQESSVIVTTEGGSRLRGCRRGRCRCCRLPMKDRRNKIRTFNAKLIIWEYQINLTHPIVLGSNVYFTFFLKIVRRINMEKNYLLTHPEYLHW